MLNKQDKLIFNFWAKFESKSVYYLMPQRYFHDVHRLTDVAAYKTLARAVADDVRVPGRIVKWADVCEGPNIQWRVKLLACFLTALLHDSNNKTSQLWSASQIRTALV